MWKRFTGLFFGFFWSDSILHLINERLVELHVCITPVVFYASLNSLWLPVYQILMQ
jgi:hypothetical protein